MSEKIIVPTLGESVTEATVSKWLKSVGEEVDSDEEVRRTSTSCADAFLFSSFFWKFLGKFLDSCF